MGQANWSGFTDGDGALIRVFVLFYAALTAIFVFNNTLDGLAADYCFVIAIGLGVGATELMARYRDDPFAPLRSGPGIYYMLVNAGAAALAFFLLRQLNAGPANPALRVLAAGLTAMAVFRSGLFVTRIGGSDVAVGPNLILQVILAALDRAYDRLRAPTRSEAAVRIMSEVGFTEAQVTLPALCLNLMQNVSSDEQAALGREVEALKARSMPDEAKALSLGLTLFNLVGRQTLQSAVDALGNSVRPFKAIDDTLLLTLAKVDPAEVLAALPAICNGLASKGRRLEVERLTDLMRDIDDQSVSEDAKVIQMLYRLIGQFGEPVVKAAINILAV